MIFGGEKTQAYSIIGAFHSRTPASIRIEGGLLFWTINLIPVAASVLYLDQLARDRLQSLVTSRPTAKKIN